MLSFFRAFSKSWVASGIMGLLMLTFLLLGNGSVRDLFRFRQGDAVVQAGSRVVTSSQFQTDFQRVLTNLQERAQQAVTADDAVEHGVDQALVDNLSVDNAYAEMLSRLGIRPSKDVVRTEFVRAAGTPGSPFAELFNPISGRLDERAYSAFLQRNGMTQDEFERRFSDGVADEDFSAAAGGGFRLPRIYAAVRMAILLEARDVSYFVIPAASIPAPAPPTDAALNALIQQNRDQLMLPERRKLTIVRFSAKDLQPGMPADPAKVQQQFLANQAKYGKPELRSLVEIPLKDPRAAESVQARLARGEDPNAIARSLGVDAVTYDNQPQSAITDRKAAAAAFAMHEGQVSGPVQGDVYPVIIKVTKLTPNQPPSLDAARPQIEADLKQQEALDKVYELSQAFEDARQSGASVAAAAAKVGVATISVGPINDQGVDQTTGQPNPALSPKLLKTAFGLPQGGDSDVEQDADKGEYYAVHVDQVVAPSLPSLSDPRVRAALTRYYIEKARFEALQHKADAAVAALKTGQSISTVAESMGGSVTHLTDLKANSADEYRKTVGDDALRAMFGAKSGTSFSAASQPLGGFLVGRVDAIRPADPSQVALLLALQDESKAYLQGLSQAARRAAVALVKPQTDLALARSVIGVDAATLAKVNAKPAAKGAGLAK
jgi:peptidyl-prolyl cis-trans isomerase D